MSNGLDKTYNFIASAVVGVHSVSFQTPKKEAITRGTQALRRCKSSMYLDYHFPRPDKRTHQIAELISRAFGVNGYSEQGPLRNFRT